MGLGVLSHSSCLEVFEEVLRINDLNLPGTVSILSSLSLDKLLEDHAIKELMKRDVQLHKRKHQFSKDFD